MIIRHTSLALALSAAVPSLVHADKDQAPRHQPKLTLAAAQAIAIKRVPGTVTEAELEREKGVWVYEIEIQPADPAVPRQEVLVHADDGTIVSIGEDD